MDNLLDEIVLADQLGLDVLGGGEHQRSEFLIRSQLSSWLRSLRSLRTFS